MDLTHLNWAPASEAARLIREGAVTSVQYVEACLELIGKRDADVQAWAFLDPEYALAQARAADELRLTGQAIGPLHGVPVGLKDIIDTADMPTENGSVICAGRTPSRDAAVVSLLRAAGAVIMGKTVTTEFATRHPGKMLPELARRAISAYSEPGQFVVDPGLHRVGVPEVVEPAVRGPHLGAEPGAGLVRPRRRARGRAGSRRLARRAWPSPPRRRRARRTPRARDVHARRGSG